MFFFCSCVWFANHVLATLGGMLQLFFCARGGAGSESPRPGCVCCLLLLRHAQDGVGTSFPNAGASVESQRRLWHAVPVDAMRRTCASPVFCRQSRDSTGCSSLREFLVVKRAMNTIRMRYIGKKVKRTTGKSRAIRRPTARTVERAVGRMIDPVPYLRCLVRSCIAPQQGYGGGDGCIPSYCPLGGAES